MLSVSVGGATSAKNVQVSLKDFVVLDVGCVPQTLSHQRENHAVQCAKLQDMEETSAATEVFVVLLTGLSNGQNLDNDSNIFYWGSNEGRIYKSLDAGSTWTLINQSSLLLKISFLISTQYTERQFKVYQQTKILLQGLEKKRSKR